ncbi:MAG TPA: IclR family transcriptional regulator [Caulobacteraceae bacterium]|nr:IclR family transcriptional regulator [Caulobacteraceae bacterium]
MRSVEVALKVLEEIGWRQPIGVSELSRRLGLSKTTVQRSLSTLRRAGWIEPAAEARTAWSLSIRALVVGGRAIEAGRGLRAIAIPVMEDVRRRTEETIHLMVRERASVVLIERLDGIKPVQVFNPLGGRALLHRTSSGKAVLANLPADERSEYLSRPLTTGRTRQPVDLATLESELALVRERGFALNLSSNQPDVNAVGAAIFDPAQRPIGAITVSAPAARMTEAVCLANGPIVADAARRITMGLRLRA